MPRIYVASLSDYNAGNLHGKWIDANQDPDAIRDEIDAMLRESKFPNVEVDCPECGDMVQSSGTACSTCKDTGKVPSAEEFAIHDYEGFGEIKIGEFDSIETVAELASLLAEHDGAFEVAYGNFHSLEEAKEAVTEHYNGAWKDEEDFAYQHYEDLGSIRKDDPLIAYVDWERVARDLFISDYWSGRDSSGTLHVFRNA